MQKGPQVLSLVRGSEDRGVEFEAVPCVFSDLLGSFCRGEFEADISDRTHIWTMLSPNVCALGRATWEGVRLKEIRASAR